MSTTPTVKQIELYRQQFPALTNKAYFNYGGQGPLSERSLAQILQAHEQMQRSGPFSNQTNDWMNQEAKQTREAIATELGTSAQTITLTDSVSTGCNIALWGLDWHQGDHVLVSDCEHPGILAAILEIQRRFGIEVSTCPLMATLNQGDPVAVIAQHLRSTTRLVLLSHILWNTGQLLPLADIAEVCHRYPATAAPVRLLIDAAQSIGTLPLKLEELGVDFYAFTGHKWWCGPAGIGALYVRPDALESLNPTFIGWRGITKNAAGYPTGWEAGGSRFEVATSDYPLFGALRTAIAMHHQWGTATERYQRILELSRYLWQRLSELPAITCLRMTPPETGLVSFQVKDYRSSTHARLVQFLEQRGFLLRTILDPSCVRACVHYFTLESEIDQLIEAISNFA
jgi:L-cysteine/cystine lyase